MTSHRVPKLRLGSDSVARLRDRLREVLRRTHGRSLPAIVYEMNQYLRGWLGYFRLIETPSVLKKLQSWIQRKLRCYRIKQLRRASKPFWELKNLVFAQMTSSGYYRPAEAHGGSRATRKFTKVSAQPTGRPWTSSTSPSHGADSERQLEPPGTDPYAEWCGRGEPRGFLLSRLGRQYFGTYFYGQNRPPNLPA